MFQNDKLIKISTGGSRKATNWIGQELLWSDFVSKLSKPIRTDEKFEVYRAMTKAQQDELKDVGGFVGGELKSTQRRNTEAGNRHLITLDADNIPAGATEDILKRVGGLGCAYVVYSTRKHESAAPRLRIIFPLDIPATPDEYEPIARKMALLIGIEIFDPTTFEAVRLMYWSSCSANSEYVFYYGDMPFLSKDGILAMYGDWRNVQEWPEVPGVVKIRDKSLKKQGNPVEKHGVVGAFCRVYDVPAAIDKFLSEIYEPCGDGRYTYAKGSTVGGAILYDNGNFLYSHHATDPAGGKLCNAFDLVRLYNFGEDDSEVKEGTPIASLPSYKAMCEFALQDEKVRRERIIETFKDINTGDDAESSIEWAMQLDTDSKGLPKSSIMNVQLILANDINLRDRLAYEEFSAENRILGQLPWKRSTDSQNIWSDSDYSGLRAFLEKNYKIKGKQIIDDALSNHLRENSFHEVRKYFNELQWDGVSRLDSVFIDYLGAEDTPYVRAVTRKSFVAAVARIFVPGIKFDTMTVLCSERQGIGKSTLLSIMGGDWYTDNLLFTDMNNKGSSEKIQGKLLIEVSELQGYKKTETDIVKAFITRRVEHYRPAYGRTTIQRPRQCIFFGTTNTMEFLKDDTGNRRFWPVDTDIQNPIKNVFKDLENERNQIWAEAVSRWRVGEKLYVEGELLEEALKAQEAHFSTDPRESMILDFVNKKIPINWYSTAIEYRLDYWAYGEKTYDGELMERRQICAAEIWVECFRMPLRDMKQKDTREINTVLKSMKGWEPINTRFGTVYGKQRGFVEQSYKYNLYQGNT